LTSASVLFDVNIDTRQYGDFVVRCDILGPLGFILDPGSTAFRNGQAMPFGFAALACSIV